MIARIARYASDLAALGIALCIGTVGLYGLDWAILGIMLGETTVAAAGGLLALAAIAAAGIVGYTVLDEDSTQD